MAPGQRAEANALRSAFGSDYEAKLRQEAGALGWGGRAGAGGGCIPAAGPLVSLVTAWAWGCAHGGATGPLSASSLPWHPAPEAASPTTLAFLPYAPLPPSTLPPGPDPSKLAKRRHQIGSLYHAAKQQELQQLDMRTLGKEAKGNAARKYGW